MTALDHHLKRAQRAAAVVGVAVGCFFGLVYFTLTMNEIAPGAGVFIWQIPAAGALIGTSTGFLARALSMQRPLGGWLALQVATMLVVFVGFATTTG